MNIVLVVFDSWRKDCTGVYGSPPWGKVHTPNFDRFAEESLIMTRAFPESLPTLPARRALYTGRRVYPFHNGDFRLKGDFIGAPGWGPIPEEQPTLAELLSESHYRTALISDVYHMFKPSKNFWRGFHQWTFLRGQEADRSRSGPRLTQAEIDYWLPEEIRNRKEGVVGHIRLEGDFEGFIQGCITNIRDRTREEDYFAPRVLKEAALWLEQNRDADRFFLTVESFDPHEPWLVPDYYRRMYMEEEGREQVISLYQDVSDLDPKLLARTRANYSGEVTMCDRWFGFFMDTLKAQGLLDDTLVILTSDHGHSIGDLDYMGKRPYPSAPEVYDIPLMIRFPGAEHAGTSSDQFVQHHDIAAVILEAAGVEPPPEIDGSSFLGSALSRETGRRDHVTIGWGSSVTVLNNRWWLNCKVDGSGILLHDLKQANPFSVNVAEENPETVNELFALAKTDAGGGFPEWILELARTLKDAPGCSNLVARA
jgi:arylsulfatase A-like enzyme